MICFFCQNEMNNADEYGFYKCKICPKEIDQSKYGAAWKVENYVVIVLTQWSELRVSLDPTKPQIYLGPLPEDKTIQGIESYVNRFLKLKAFL